MRNFFDPILNCTSTSVPLLLIEFTSNGLGIFLNALPNNPKQRASRTVDLPAPFSPIISVVGFLSNCISIKVFPVERKFFQRTDVKLIKFPNPVPQYKGLS